MNFEYWWSQESVGEFEGVTPAHVENAWNAAISSAVLTALQSDKSTHPSDLAEEISKLRTKSSVSRDNSGSYCKSIDVNGLLDELSEIECIGQLSKLLREHGIDMKA